MEYGLRDNRPIFSDEEYEVLILVLMEYGLRVGAPMLLWRGRYGGLNPCFNGIWSARSYKFCLEDTDNA